MQLSALLALLPLAAALPQARGPVEARAVEVETRDNIEDSCEAAYNKCTYDCDSWTRGTLQEFWCTSMCRRTLEHCQANQTEKRAVEEAPVEARDIDDECWIELNQCCHTSRLEGEYKNMKLAACMHTTCGTALRQCEANQTEKRSVEDTLIQTRDNHAGDVTDCYDDVADCKADGGSIEKCYAPLKDCLWNLYYKYFD